jgi:(R,R)-butanediol dehydrogenase/meso-butanediol dehydrogenase/diacetyl reductase
MKAAVFHGPKDLRVEKVERPALPEGWVRVRIKSCGICGSDLHMYKGDSPELKEYQIDLNKGCRGVFGHEASGDIEEVGEGVLGALKVGDRVAVCPMWGCGSCELCRSGSFHLCRKQACIGYTHVGGYSENVVVPAFVCYRVHDDISYSGAALIEPLSNGIHACNRGQVSSEDVVVILGAGPIGLATTAAAKAMGARRIVVVDMLEHPLKVAGRLGADQVINSSVQDVSQEVLRYVDEDDISVIVEAVGGGQRTTLPLAIRLASRRARIVCIGIFSNPQEVDVWGMQWKEVSLVPSWAFCYNKNRHEYKLAVDLVSSKRVSLEPILTHRVPIDEITRGFDLAINKNENAIKIHIIPD